MARSEVNREQEHEQDPGGGSGSESEGGSGDSEGGSGSVSDNSGDNVIVVMASTVARDSGVVVAWAPKGRCGCGWRGRQVPYVQLAQSIH